MTVGRIATIPFLALVSLSGCIEEEPAQCSVKPGLVNSIVVTDGQNPRNDIARLDVMVTGTGFTDHRFAVEPWPGETVFRFPYRLNPIITAQAGGTVTVIAHNGSIELVSSGTRPLESAEVEGCVFRAGPDYVAHVELVDIN